MGHSSLASRQVPTWTPQHVGMGKDFYEEFPLFAQVFDHAPVDFDLKELCFTGPEEKLAFRGIHRLAPSSLASSPALSTAALSPPMTSWPGQL